MITSTSNIQVKTVINLLKKSGERKKSGLFVIEGLRIFMEAPAALVAQNIRIREFYCSARKTA